ncbi:hypothetical protein D3C72_1211850 [compost metagenome]
MPESYQDHSGEHRPCDGRYRQGQYPGEEHRGSGRSKRHLHQLLPELSARPHRHWRERTARRCPDPDGCGDVQCGKHSAAKIMEK